MKDYLPPFLWGRVGEGKEPVSKIPTNRWANKEQATKEAIMRRQKVKRQSTCAVTCCEGEWPRRGIWFGTLFVASKSNLDGILLFAFQDEQARVSRELKVGRGDVVALRLRDGTSTEWVTADFNPRWWRWWCSSTQTLHDKQHAM